MKESNMFAAKSAVKSGLFIFIALLLAGCGGGGWGDIPTTVTLKNITVSPATLTVSQGKTASLSAMGTYSDGSTADLSSKVAWVAAEPATVVVRSDGIVSGAALGTTTVTAKLNGITSIAANISVISFNLSSIAITPATTTLAKGTQASLTAVGTYTDGSSSDISTQVNWTSASPAIATVGASTGTVTGTATGSTTINASMDGITSPVANITVTSAVLNSIRITSGATLAKGTTTNLSAAGTYSDGTTADLTTQVAWTSADPSTATVGSNTGSLIGTAVGVTTVSAALNGITSNTASITVTAATLGSLSISPSSTTLAKGTNANLSVIGTYSDGNTANLTTQVTWTSGSPAIASVGTNTGVVLASAVGSTSISASLDGVFAPAASVTVTPAVLVSINLAPGSASLAKGTSTSFTATGTYSDGTTANITTQATWTSVAPSTAAVGANTGIVVGVAEGTTTVFTALASITSPTVSVTVTPKVLTSIAVTPVSAAIAKDGYQSYTATGTYSDGSTGIITGSVAWHSSNTAVAIMNLSGGASGLSVGPVNISASLSGITSDSATLNIIAGFAGGASGLTTGHSIGLSNNGIDNLTLNGGPPYIPFSFATRLNHGAAYNLTITSVPAGMNCASLYGTGIVGTDNVTNMYVFCGLLYTGQWAATGINSTRVGHTATLLRDMMPNGKVLVAGGSAGSTSSYIFDPANPATPVIAAALTHTRTKHAATLLAVPFLSPPGLVLVSGGEGVAPGTYLASAELYNPTTDSWVDTGSLNLARSMHTSTLLNNGRVLVVGGLGGPIPVAIPVAEQYVIVTPTVGYWVPAGNLITARYGHTATLLPNGKVLVAGGNDTSGVALSSAELYDPATGQWSATGSLSTARFQHTATLLPDGRVLVVAGGAAAGLASAELYNPATGQWVATNSTHWPHQQHTATLLPSGNVLVVGGPIGYEANTELFNPASGTWTITSSLNTGRSAHTATLLPDGKVMVWGGSGTSGTGSTELYW